jgi:hypothetical protein
VGRKYVHVTKSPPSATQTTGSAQPCVVVCAGQPRNRSGSSDTWPLA